MYDLDLAMKMTISVLTVLQVVKHWAKVKTRATTYSPSVLEHVPQLLH